MLLVHYLINHQFSDGYIGPTKLFGCHSAFSIVIHCQDVYLPVSGAKLNSRERAYITLHYNRLVNANSAIIRYSNALNSILFGLSKKKQRALY